MIELIDNIIQLFAIARGGRERALLCLVEGTYFLGSLFWTLFQAFYGETPRFYIADMGWYSSWMFLTLLLIQIRHPDLAAQRYILPRYTPVFCGGMGVFFYIMNGEFFPNLITSLIMSMLAYHAISGLIFLRGRTDSERNKRFFYILVIVYILVEYTLWTLSCVWRGDTSANPYFWVDFLLTVCCAAMLPALRKAVSK